MTKASFTVVILLALTMPASAQSNPLSSANDMLSGCKGLIGDKTPFLREALGQGRCAGYVAGARRERGGRTRPEPHDRTTRYDQGPVAAPSRRFSFCLSSRARAHIPVLIPHRLRVLGPEHGNFCIVLLNTQCEEVPMK